MRNYIYRRRNCKQYFITYEKIMYFLYFIVYIIILFCIHYDYIIHIKHSFKTVTDCVVQLAYGLLAVSSRQLK